VIVSFLVVWNGSFWLVQHLWGDRWISIPDARWLGSVPLLALAGLSISVLASSTVRRHLIAQSRASWYEPGIFVFISVLSSLMVILYIIHSAVMVWG
jgi:hypothetical protein